MSFEYSPHIATWLRRPPPVATALQHRWLTAPGALTARLRALGRVTVQVVHEAAEGATRDEACALGCAERDPVWVREVTLHIDGRPAVAARSLTPLADSRGAWRALRSLRSRPLADILYHDRSIHRSAFASAILKPSIPLHSVVDRAWRVVAPSASAHTRYLARRSVFVRDSRPLLVAEAFLPDFWDRATLAAAARKGPPPAVS